MERVHNFGHYQKFIALNLEGTTLNFFSKFDSFYCMTRNRQFPLSKSSGAEIGARSKLFVNYQKFITLILEGIQRKIKQFLLLEVK